MKLGLGTVQFGLDYGISNPAGKVPVREVHEILDEARLAGMEIIDTAAAYGVSEEVLGECLPKNGFRVVTKLEPIRQAIISEAALKAVGEQIERSRRRLRREKLDAVLLHDADDLLAKNGERLWDELIKYKAYGWIERVGVSVYSREQIERVQARFPVEVIQLPLNVLDQRLLKDNFLKNLKATGVEIHARSVFLQGMLLSPSDELDQRFDSVRGHLRSYEEYLATFGLSPLQGALSFISSVPEIDHAIVGVLSRKQLAEIIAAFTSLAVPVENWAKFAWWDERILNPAMWNLLASGAPCP
jgi:aryl-alcohol dehydrogenase-like predicted oxidoreductase